MDLHEALLKLRRSKEKDMIPEDAFLAHAFVMRDEAGGEEWQIGYYSPSSMLMTSFMIGETITMLPPAEVLKADVEIHELNPASVTITPVNAFHTAEKVVKEHYKGALAARVFYIIQHLEMPVYNITFITRQFSTINVRVDAATGDVVHHSSENLVFIEKGEAQRTPAQAKALAEKNAAHHAAHVGGAAGAGKDAAHHEGAATGVGKDGAHHAGVATGADKDVVYGKSPAEALKKAQAEAKRRRAGKK